MLQNKDDGRIAAHLLGAWVTGRTSSLVNHLLQGKDNWSPYPELSHCIRYYEADRAKCLVFPTNNIVLPARTIAALCQSRWRIELFFQWIVVQALVTSQKNTFRPQTVRWPCRRVFSKIHRLDIKPSHSEKSFERFRPHSRRISATRS